jgi:multiple sugar transport system permease protein
MNTAISTPSSAAKKTKKSDKIKATFNYSLLIVVTFILMIPIFWLFITSLKRDIEYLSYPITFLPAIFQFQNYSEVFKPLYTYLAHTWNTLVLATIYSVLCVFISSLVGYAFARYRDVKANQKLFAFVVAMLIIPSIVTVIPAFMIFSKLHLTGTYWPWVLWGLGGAPYHIFLFRQFFLTFPKELEDAAEVDGCSPFGTYWRIFLPNANAAIATSFIINFIGVWGDWLTPRIYLNASNTTIGVIINYIFKNPQGQFLTTLTITGIVIYTLPMIIIFFIGQRYILKGVVTSGLAGR